MEKNKSNKVVNPKKEFNTIRSDTANRGVRARRKGHSFERAVSKFFKRFGYNHACTSRLGSRLMDNAKIDICNIPFNVQCKADESNINYNKLTEEIKTEIAKLIPERLVYPILIFHKKNKKTNVIMTLEQFDFLMTKYIQNNDNNKH